MPSEIAPSHFKLHENVTTLPPAMEGIQGVFGIEVGQL